MTTKQEQYEHRRGQILQTALDLFVYRGYHGTSTREISKAAGISSGLMFHYFESKEHVYEELVAIGCGRMDIDFEGLMANPREALHSLVNDLLTMLKTNPRSAKIFVLIENALFHREISAKVNAMLDARNVVEQCKAVIAHGQHLGQFKPGDPLALSLAFWNSIQGIAQHLALRPDHPVPEAEWLMDILRKKSEVL